MASLDFQSDQWATFVGKVAAHEDGEIIRHEWLRDELGLAQPDPKEFSNMQDLVKALDLRQFEYMTLIERLKEDLLKGYKVCIKNERGIGYSVVPPKEQTAYAFDKMTADINKALRTAAIISGNVRSVDFVQRAKDNDLRAKMVIMKDCLSAIR